MERIKRFMQENDWQKVGIAAYYGYFAVNVLVKALGYDSSDQIYKFFMLSGIMFLAIKLVTTKYTLREVIWCALLLGSGMVIWAVTKMATLLFLFVTIIGMKGCSYRKLIGISVWLRIFVAAVMVVGSFGGVYDIGYKTTPNAQYVEVPVYGFGFGEPNTAFLTIFLALALLIYYNYERLNGWWFAGTSCVALLFYEFTFCRTGIIVFFFLWALIFYEKLVKEKKAKFILALSVPVGALFSFAMMLLYDSESSLMSTLDRYTSGRVHITGNYYQDQGLALLPRNQELFYASYHGLIDNAYMYILLYCGWIFALGLFAAICVALFRLYRRGCYRELVLIGAFALYGVLEQFVLNGFMNPFILLMGILLYPGLLRTDMDGGANGKVSYSSNS